MRFENIFCHHLQISNARTVKFRSSKKISLGQSSSLHQSLEHVIVRRQQLLKEARQTLLATTMPQEALKEQDDNVRPIVLRQNTPEGENVPFDCKVPK